MSSGARCHHCGAKARYHQRYSGARLCGGCFIKALRRRIIAEVRKGRMLEDAQAIAVAVSGGKDSVACLDMVEPLARSRNIPISVITIDEGIAGYRKEGVEKAREAARTRGLEFHLTSFREHFGLDLDSIIERIGSPERSCTYCGVLRRWLLNKTARELGADRLVTGHNLDDEAQSALLNLIRGDSARLARSSSEYLLSHSKLVPRAKPLRRIPGKETLLYDIFSGLDVHLGVCPYSKFDMRNEVRSFLSSLEEERPTSKSSLLSTIDKLSSASRGLYAGLRLTECSSCGEPTIGPRCKACQLLETVGLR